MASVTPHDLAHSAAWHVGPGVGDLALMAADSRSLRLIVRATTNYR
jgi:hypothetical protein